MSGVHRKVSRSLADASAAISPGTGSHAHFKQPENELKQKLDALDTSFKISNKKISSETRELRQILFDLQRDLRASKSANQYVPSSFEEQGQAKRQRRITVALGNRELSPRDDDTIKSSSPETMEGLQSKGSKATPTKRQRKVSGASPRQPKILVQEEDVLKSENIGGRLINEKETDLGTEGVMVTVEPNEGLTNAENCMSLKQEVQQTQANKQHGEAYDGESEIFSRAERIPMNLTLDPKASESKKESNITDDSQGRVRKTSHSGVFSYSSSSSDTKTFDRLKPSPTGSTYGLTYSKHFNEERKRSLSDSDASYRDTFKGRFMTQSLPEKLKDQCRIDLRPQESQKRTRRVTVSGPPPMGARRLIDIADIPVTPFHPGPIRKKSTGRGPTGGLPKRRGTEKEDSSAEVFDDNEITRDKYNLTVGRSQEAKQRRYSSVYKPTSSSLPPLKEETHNAARQAEAAKQWENLDQCRYLRKGNEVLSIEDIFRKD
ncbi:uncharacterized protein LOC110252910 [Exaiptasia diaphana]|uniref:Uncharacterized protein n=1 Tax=Exaiptasia diaphana TaxID=2652724 RepID=A0A913Y6B7_EXADI|nr:uncharacterized protein LOC110252910 [Exaiptasia diaphana]KXJ22167.1 hypothetical protein AC249_AIPGENE4189 [Exaiptasia diaphana]